MAEALAFRIVEDLVQMRWPLDQRLGDEPEIIARYRVSRWVFRQAIRLLEAHGIVEMRPGQGGGLFVREPDPSIAVGAAVAYLHSINLNRKSALSLWQYFMETAAYTAANSTHFAIQPAKSFSLQMIESQENRPLALFGLIINNYLFANRKKAALAEDQGAVSVLAAISAGDASLARRRMRRYLQQSKA